MCDGRDITPFLTGTPGPVREACFTEHVWTKRLRTPRWSFVHYQRAMFPDVDHDAGELYDMEADPWELHNLYGDPGYREVVEDLRRRVLEWMIGTQHPATILPMPTAVRQPDGAGSKQRLPEDGRIPPRAIERFVGEGGNRNYL
jgi:hypothetical protein